MDVLDLPRYQHIVVLTGAGISVASGLRPYRGPGGLWEEHDSSALATAAAFAEAPLSVWNLFAPLRVEALAAEPNPAHFALASVDKRFPGRMTVITQNVDGLHERAGSEKVLDIHGNIHRTRCSNTECKLEPFIDDAVPTEVPLCPQCGSALRPDVVLFQEAIPGGLEWHAKRALNASDLFLAIGTSGTVSPASNFVRAAEYAGAETIFINVNPMDPPNPKFQRTILGKAEEVLPVLLS